MNRIVLVFTSLLLSTAARADLPPDVAAQIYQGAYSKVATLDFQLRDALQAKLTTAYASFSSQSGLSQLEIDQGTQLYRNLMGGLSDQLLAGAGSFPANTKWGLTWLQDNPGITLEIAPGEGSAAVSKQVWDAATSTWDRTMVKIRLDPTQIMESLDGDVLGTLLHETGHFIQNWQADQGLVSMNTIGAKSLSAEQLAGELWSNTFQSGDLSTGFELTGQRYGLGATFDTGGFPVDMQFLGMPGYQYSGGDAARWQNVFDSAQSFGSEPLTAAQRTEKILLDAQNGKIVQAATTFTQDELNTGYANLQLKVIQEKLAGMNFVEDTVATEVPTIGTSTMFTADAQAAGQALAKETTLLGDVGEMGSGMVIGTFLMETANWGVSKGMNWLFGASSADYNNAFGTHLDAGKISTLQANTDEAEHLGEMISDPLRAPTTMDYLLGMGDAKAMAHTIFVDWVGVDPNKVDLAVKQNAQGMLDMITGVSSDDRYNVNDFIHAVSVAQATSDPSVQYGWVYTPTWREANPGLASYADYLRSQDIANGTLVVDVAKEAINNDMANLIHSATAWSFQPISTAVTSVTAPVGSPTTPSLTVVDASQIFTNSGNTVDSKDIYTTNPVDSLAVAPTSPYFTQLPDFSNTNSTFNLFADWANASQPSYFTNQGVGLDLSKPPVLVGMTLGAAGIALATNLVAETMSGDTVINLNPNNSTTVNPDPGSAGGFSDEDMDYLDWD